MGSFDAFCKKSQETWKKGKENAAAFGQDVPAGTYIGKLTKLALTESQNGNWMISRAVTITEGEYAGSTARDNMNLNNEIGMAIAIQFIEKHDVAAPEVLNEKSLKKALDTILENDPVYRFRLTFKNDFPKITVLDIGEDDTAETETETETTPGEKETEAEDDSNFGMLVDFCQRQGIEVGKKDDIDSLKEKIADYKFPAEGVTKEQLVEAGFDADDLGDEIDSISTEDVALLTENDLAETIIMPEVKKEKPKARKPLGKKK